MATDKLKKCALHDESRFEQFADVIFVNRVPHSGSGVMVRAGISYGQQTQLHFIDSNLNAQRYRDEILWPIVVPFIRRHYLMFQHEVMHGPVSQGSIHSSWKLKMSQFFLGLCTHQICHRLSMFGMLWVDVYDSLFQFTPISTTSQSH